MEGRFTENETKLIAGIRAIRARHRCCSIEPLAATIGFSRGYTIQMAERLRERNVVAWSPNVRGSIHIVGEYDNPSVDSAIDLDDAALLAAAAGAIALPVRDMGPSDEEILALARRDTDLGDVTPPAEDPPVATTPSEDLSIAAPDGPLVVEPLLAPAPPPPATSRRAARAAGSAAGSSSPPKPARRPRQPASPRPARAKR